MPDKTVTKCYAFGAPDKRVDTAARVVYGVAVATKGPAVGHDEHLDDESLDQLVILGNAAMPNATGSLKARMDHPISPSADQPTIENPLGKLIGKPLNFRRDGDVVRADIHLFSPAAAPMADQFMALAAEAPEHLGASIVFNSLKQSGKDPAVRFVELFAVDFVDFPATNPTGLFAATNGGGKETCMSNTLKGYERDGKLFAVIGDKEYEMDLPKNWAAADAHSEPDGDEDAEGNEPKGKEEKYDITNEASRRAAMAQMRKDGSLDSQNESAKITPQMLSMAATNAVKAEREYRKGFFTALTTAGIVAKDAEDFETKFYGRPLDDVKFLASHAIGTRAKPVGEGNPGNGETETKTAAEKSDAAIVAECTKRFSADATMRRMYGCFTSDANDATFKAKLAKYVAAERKCQADQNAAKSDNEPTDDSIARLYRNKSVFSTR